jgi:ubiquinol-cytochrome c reductase iron-sulfur subunit
MSDQAANPPFHPGDTNRRRRFLTRATSTMAGIGVAVTAVPFVESLLPSARAKAGGAPVEIDVSKLAVGQKMTVRWRSRPIWIIHRSKEELATLPKMMNRVADPYSKVPQQPPDMKNLHLKEGIRAIKPEYLVLVGICTHLGCIPDYKPVPHSIGSNWLGGFLCPCHGSRYDLSGRVLKDFPAPRNLPVPPYYYKKDTLIKIGTLKNGGDQTWQPETW